MKRKPRIGDTGELSFTVEQPATILFSDDKMPPVLSTPHLVLQLELAAREALVPLFDEGEMCVGTHVDIEHLAATLLGCHVTCTARVIHVDEPFVSFQVEARDEHEVLARGIHKRAVIEVERFARRVNRKAAKVQR